MGIAAEKHVSISKKVVKLYFWRRPIKIRRRRGFMKACVFGVPLVIPRAPAQTSGHFSCSQGKSLLLQGVCLQNEPKSPKTGKVRIPPPSENIEGVRKIPQMWGKIYNSDRSSFSPCFGLRRRNFSNLLEGEFAGWCDGTRF